MRDERRQIDEAEGLSKGNRLTLRNWTRKEGIRDFTSPNDSLRSQAAEFTERFANCRNRVIEAKWPCRRRAKSNTQTRCERVAINRQVKK
jgi:hypothetical protein